MTFPCTSGRAQESGCFGETFVQVLRDENEEDLRATCVIPYPGSTDLLIGGTIGGNIFLTRIGREGALRWRRVISTPSLSTELSTVAEIIVDETGMIAGAGSTFDANNEQLLYVFRYDPLADAVLYFHQPPYPSEATGLKIGAPGEYLLSGSKNGEPTPVFNSAFLARIDRETGLPLNGGRTFDLGGDESFLDLFRLPDGTSFAGGRVAASGGTGATRANVTRLGPEGQHEWTRSGYAPNDVNARLFTFDIEVIDNTVYVLSWGNVGVITASLGTAMVLSAFSLDGTHQWTRRYDVADFEGEEAVELVPHNGGLLAYGYRLIGQRTPYLVHVDLAGDLRWARTYDLPGITSLYIRCNQQILTDAQGIFMLANYSGTGRPREGALLRLDGNGRSDNVCLGIRDIDVSVVTLNATWTEATLEVTPQTAPWSPSPSAGRPESIMVYDDCDQSCDGCFSPVFTRTAICRGESLLIGGLPRSEAGVYADTIPGLVNGCDSILLTDLVVSDGPEVAVSVSRSCGFATADVQLTTTGGEFPYSFLWSTPQASGSRASLPAGDYTVTVNDALACNPAVVDVVVDDAPSGGIDFRFDAPFCPGDSTGVIRFEPAGSGSIRLLSGGEFTTDRIGGLTPGSYSVILRDSTGCEAFRQIDIPEARPASIEINAPEFVRLGDEIALSASPRFGSLFSAYNWSATDTITCPTCPVAGWRPAATGMVFVDAVTERGCPVRDSALVRVTTGPARIYLPTGFSPNGDNVNDRWLPGLGPEIDRVLEWQVYDRWGNLCWEYAGGEDWWTGANAAVGVYTYTIRVRLIDGREEARRGEITLTR